MEVERRPIQIVFPNAQTQQFELNLSEFEKVIVDSDVSECKIAIISIAGVFRKGKSFLLNFMLRYLEANNEDSTDWLGNDDSQLTGFSWCGGSNRQTTGIWIWPKVFIRTQPNGEKIGVMLMDTQGMFDCGSTMKDNITIFSMSTMLSSVQIFNVFNNLQEDDLHNLQLFNEYAKLAMGETSNSLKPFQSLLFLVRDWQSPQEYQYGAEGGDNLVKNKLQNDAIGSKIQSNYEKINGFLLPNPGMSACITQNFNGKLVDLEKSFKDGLLELIPMILEAKTLITKKINGHDVKGKELIGYFNGTWTSTNEKL